MGDILRKRFPAITCSCLTLRRGNSCLEQVSATTFSADATHEVRTFRFFFSKYKWMPCAQRSKGALVHRAVSIHVFAVVLSNCSVVNRPVQKSVRVSHVTNAAMNSATLISTTPGLNSGMGAMMDHSAHVTFQNKDSSISDNPST